MRLKDRGHINNTLEPIEVNVILAVEEHPPEGKKAIHWLLLTTLDVPDFETAHQCL